MMVSVAEIQEIWHTCQGLEGEGKLLEFERRLAAYKARKFVSILGMRAGRKWPQEVQYEMFRTVELKGLK